MAKVSALPFTVCRTFESAHMCISFPTYNVIHCFEIDMYTLYVNPFNLAIERFASARVYGRPVRFCLGLSWSNFSSISLSTRLAA